MLHLNCHHEAIYAKLNLKVHDLPPYERDVWHDKEGDTDPIWRSAELFYWDRAFTSSTVNDTVDNCTKAFQNIISNFIPQMTISIDNKDPPWFKKVSTSREKNYKNFRKNPNNIQL